MGEYPVKGQEIYADTFSSELRAVRAASPDAASVEKALDQFDPEFSEQDTVTNSVSQTQGFANDALSFNRYSADISQPREGTGSALTPRKTVQEKHQQLFSSIREDQDISFPGLDKLFAADDQGASNAGGQTKSDYSREKMVEFPEQNQDLQLQSQGVQTTKDSIEHEQNNVLHNNPPFSQGSKQAMLDSEPEVNSEEIDISAFLDELESDLDSVHKKGKK